MSNFPDFDNIFDQPDERPAKPQLKKTSGWGQGLQGMQKVSWLNKPKPLNHEDRRAIAGYVLSDEAISDHRERMEPGEALIEGGIDRALSNPNPFGGSPVHTPMARLAIKQREILRQRAEAAAQPEEEVIEHTILG